MDHSIINDNNRQENLFDSLNFIQQYSRKATTRKLIQRSMPGIIQLNLHTSDNHLTLKSRFSFI